MANRLGGDGRHHDKRDLNRDFKFIQVQLRTRTSLAVWHGRNSTDSGNRNGLCIGCLLDASVTGQIEGGNGHGLL